MTLKTNFRRVRKISKSAYWASSCISILLTVLPLAWIQVLFHWMDFHEVFIVWGFVENMSRKFTSHQIKVIIMSYLGTAVAQWLRCCTTNRKVTGSIPDGVNGSFHWYKIPPNPLWPWGRLILKQKWVPGAFPGDKSGRCVELTNLPPSCAVVMKSGNLNFLETSGPLQACNGTASFIMYCLHEGQHTLMIICCSFLLKTKNVLDKYFRENTYFVLHYLKKSCLLW